MKNNEINNLDFGSCGRKEDLVAYLYNEVGGAERSSFEGHLNDCPSCREELAGFGRVRDDLSAWEVGFTPSARITIPKSVFDIVREFLDLFPAWARGLAMTAVAASLLLFALGFAGVRIGAGGYPNPGSLQVSINSAEIQSLVNQALDKQRVQLEEEYKQHLATLKEQLNRENEARLKAISAENEARIEAVKAGLRAEIRKSSRPQSSIRGFFAMDDYQDPLGDAR